ncbi:pirin domain-containing protein [Piptocephalis cylindrospora]|uniref:Pirin domain-containing protein n=1 Tax=Piptocephalis cylindrospora TaxID=1907219 RepID=A0A4P9Y2I1_9FUNG|nr:pirin domain-containing protein [Piptocephalis cylindrospora]|eukprot:RKP12983.1 pirin domain-containing protein [Piptocephalis cylindrospora]
MAKITLRKGSDRGTANHGWLDTHHTFSFADYYDSRFNGFGALRVLNEDVVQPSTGFGRHPHREFEIFSYIISGELEHRDSLGHVEILKRGNVQHTTTGTGITHSEYNVHPSLPVHFLQIWAKPNKARLPPRYVTGTFEEDRKKNTLLQIVGPIEETSGAVDDEKEVKGDDPVGIHANLRVYASILSPGSKVDLPPVKTEGRKYYVHTLQTTGSSTLRSSTQSFPLSPGDGAFIESLAPSDQGLSVEASGDSEVEFLLFETE